MRTPSLRIAECFLILTLALPVSVYSQVLKKPAVIDQLQNGSSAVVKGYIGERLDASYSNRILAQDADRLVRVFTNRTEANCWQSEFWGKWFTSAVLAYKYKPEAKLRALLDRSVSDLVAAQTADGYIGNYTEQRRLEQWDIWGRKYCMLGLLSYNEITGDRKSLEAASKLADHLIKELSEKNAMIVKKGNHRGMAASSILEPIVLLYARTQQKRYLDFAEEIVRQWETEDGPQLLSRASVDVGKRFPKPKSWFGWEQGQKAYEMMSCYEGLLELYRITGNIKYKTAVEATWKNIRENEINVAGSGSSVECWFGGRALQTQPISHYQETCVTATWIKLCQQLFRLTGDPVYADAIEQTFYNALLGSMKDDGSDWSKYTPLQGKRLMGEGQCGMGINCCVASGPRGLFTIPLTTVMQHREGASVNFFIAGEYGIKTPSGRPLKITQETNYPVSDTVSLRIDPGRAEEFVIDIRIPAWSVKSFVTVNGDTTENVSYGKFVRIQRKWTPGDRIRVVFDMRGRIMTMDGTPKYIAVLRGPIVLTRDQRLGGTNVNESIAPVLDKDGFFPLVFKAENKDGIWMQYGGNFILESHKEGAKSQEALVLCDYASAGKTYDDRSWFTVWLTQYVNPRE